MFHQRTVRPPVVLHMLVDALFELGRNAIGLRSEFGHDRADFPGDEVLLLPHGITIEDASLQRTRLVLIGRELGNQALRVLRRLVLRQPDLQLAYVFVDGLLLALQCGESPESKCREAQQRRPPATAITSRNRPLLRRSACERTSRINVSVWSPMPAARARRASRTASESSESCPPAAGSGSGGAAGSSNTGGNHQGPVQIGRGRLFGHDGEFRTVATQPDHRLQAQFGLGDLLPVDERTVGAPDIANPANAALADNLEVIQRDGRTLLPLNDNVVVGCTAEPLHTVLQRIPRACQGARTQYQPGFGALRRCRVFDQLHTIIPSRGGLCNRSSAQS